MKTRSLLWTVEKSTGLLKVTVMALGVTVTVEPLAGSVESTRRTSTALIALTALIRPKPAVGFQVPARRAVHRVGCGRGDQGLLDLSRGRPGHLLEHQGRDRRGVGRRRGRAEEAGQVSPGWA